MISTQKIIKRIFQALLGLLGLAIVKIPLFNKYKLHLTFSISGLGVFDHLLFTT